MSSSGSSAAAPRTLSLPVTTSAIVYWSALIPASVLSTYLRRIPWSLPSTSPAQVVRALGVPDRRPHLRVLPGRDPDLTVEDDPVGDHNDRIEDRRVVPGQPDQLVGRWASRRWSCSCRCPPSAGSSGAGPCRARRRRPADGAPRRAGGSAARSGSAASCRSSRPSTLPLGRSSPGCR